MAVASVLRDLDSRLRRNKHKGKHYHIGILQETGIFLDLGCLVQPAFRKQQRRLRHIIGGNNTSKHSFAIHRGRIVGKSASRAWWCAIN